MDFFSVNRIKWLLVVMFSAFLAACGGSSSGAVFGQSGDTIDGGDTDTDTDSDSDSDSSGTSDLTYFPLHVYMQGDNYVSADVFEGIWFDPMIHGYMIAPVNASTLQAAQDPDVGEFVVTVDGDDVDSVEQGLMLQPVLGLAVNLNTAIIIDTSGSTQAVDRAALIQEVKDFINLAQASSDSTISSQTFTIFAFGTDILSYVGSLTNDVSVLEAALDDIENDWGDLGEASSVYGSIFFAIGSYADGATLESGATVAVDTVDDLVDGYAFNNDWLSGRTQLNGVNLSSVVLFSAGPNTRTDYQAADAKAAIEWQSFIVYDDEAAKESYDSTDSESSALQDGTALLPKPVIYVSLGSNADAGVSSLSSYVIDTDSETDFSGIAEQIISSQQSAVALRTRPENQYLVRYAMHARYGDHELIFASDTDGYNYTLTTKLTDMDGTIPDGAPAVEIAGPDNAYLANGAVSLDDASTLYPATRWTATEYTASDYSWTVGGSARAASSDGSITLTSADAGSTVVLTNNSLSTGTTTASIVVTN